MIGLYVVMFCDGRNSAAGCKERYGGEPDYADDAVLPEIKARLIERAKEAGWTIDGDYTWCPACTIQRKPSEPALAEIGSERRR